MNDRERELWVMNDEWLYLVYKVSKQSLKEFIKENKGLIDKVINGAVDFSYSKDKRTNKVFVRNSP